jgi:hypothetical protein
MSPPLWFSQKIMTGLYKPGSIVTTQKPSTVHWHILEIVKEGSSQREQHITSMEPCYATLQLFCAPLDRLNVKVYRRVYAQIPFRGTGMNVIPRNSFLNQYFLTSHKASFDSS